ncbi:HYR domain-containing protein, partial [Neolewinella agarilytica]|uniref:HYR domain-containing protein n=1 Tax=Neolewinella agarilytica TaxID=478744 RepID=UPI0023565BCB
MTTHLHFSAIGRSLLCVTLILLGATGLMAQAFSSQGSYGGATLAIPDWPIAGCGEQLTDLGGTTVLSATANVSGLPVGGNVTSITVETAINHTWVGDLDIFVEAPDGSILQLVAGAGAGTATACGASDDLVSTSPITFSDTAPQSAETMGSTTGSTVCADDGICDYSPDNDGNLLTAGTNGPQVFSFADFYPQSDGLNGNWTLYIADGGGGDTGDLVDFTVTVSGEEIACVDAAAPTIDDATARPVCDETFTMMTEMDYVYTVTPPSDGVSSSRDCRSAVIWRTPRFSDDCGVDSLAIVFSAESMPAATIIPDPLTYGSGSPEIMAQETDGYVQIITPSTYFYGSGASASTTTRVTYEVFDAEGNMETCFFFIEVVDNEDPIIDACPEDFEIAGDETSVGNGEGSDLAYSEVEVTITEAQFTAEGGDIDENCGVETITYIDVQAGTDPIIVTRTFTVTDYVGLAASCEQTITINPCIVELTCQDVTVYVDDAGNTSITPEEIQVSGSCDNTNLSLSQADFDCGDVANMPVTVTLFQNEGAQNEVSCTAEITVLDTIRPEVTCVPSFTLYLDDDGQFADPNSANFVFDNITIDTSDNCAVSGTIDRTRTLDADCTNTGEDIMVTYGFRDFSDNVTQCTVALIVLDTTPPAPVCMDLTVQLDGEGNGSIATDDNTMSQIDGGSTDNCGPLTFSEDITDFDCADIGPNTVTLTVTDPSGNVTTCDATVTVEDMVPPTLVCQDVAVFIDDMGLATIMDTSLAIMSLTDNCTDSAAIDIALIAPELGCDETTGTATLTATDIAGNVANCTIGLMAVDTISPVMTCANTVHFADEDCLFQGNAGMWTNGDNCDGIGLLEEEYFDEDGNNFLNLFFDFSANISAVLGNNRGFPLGVNTVRLTFTDASGNSGACEFTVTIEDNTPPDVVTTDQMLTLTDDEPTMTLTTGDLATATDNCGEPITIEFDRSLTFTGADIGTNELTVTVTDASGNETVTTVTVVVGFEQP